jgi:hypothetical protein
MSSISETINNEDSLPQARIYVGGVPVASVNNGQPVITNKSSAGVEQFGNSARAGVSASGILKTASVDSTGTNEARLVAPSSFADWNAFTGYHGVSYLIVGDGTPQGASKLQADAQDNLKVASISQADEVARGNVTGEKNLDKFGVNRAIGATYEDIHVYSTALDYTLYTGGSAQPMEISYSGADNDAGTGARTVIIEGVDGNGDELSETITLTAAGSPKALANSYLWINRAWVASAGTGLANAADIDISTTALATPASKTYARIGADDGQTLQSIFYVPNNYTELLIKNIEVGSSSRADTTVRLQILNGAWRTKMEHVLYSQGQSFNRSDAPISAAANSLVRIQAKVATGTEAVSATFQGILK